MPSGSQYSDHDPRCSSSNRAKIGRPSKRGSTASRRSRRIDQRSTSAGPRAVHSRRSDECSSRVRLRRRRCIAGDRLARKAHAFDGRFYVVVDPGRAASRPFPARARTPPCPPPGLELVVAPADAVVFDRAPHAVVGDAAELDTDAAAGASNHAAKNERGARRFRGATARWVPAHVPVRGEGVDDPRRCRRRRGPPGNGRSRHRDRTGSAASRMGGRIGRWPTTGHWVQ